MSNSAHMMIKNLVAEKRRVISSSADAKIALSKLPRKLQTMLRRYSELNRELFELGTSICAAGFETGIDGDDMVRRNYQHRDQETKPRYAALTVAHTSASLALMKSETPKARASVVEKLIKDLRGI